MAAFAPPAGIRPRAAPTYAVSGKSIRTTADSSFLSSTYTAVLGPSFAAGSTAGPLATVTSRPSRPSKRSLTALFVGMGMALSSAQHRREGVLERLRGERLDDDEGGTGVLRQLPHVGRALRGHEAERHLRSTGAQGAQELDAGQVRHVPVREHQVRHLAADLGQRICAVDGLHDVVAVEPGLPQRPDDDLPHHPTVVGDEDLHCGSPSSASVRICRRVELPACWCGSEVAGAGCMRVFMTPSCSSLAIWLSRCEA